MTVAVRPPAPVPPERGRMARGAIVLVVSIMTAIFGWMGALAGAKGLIGVLGIVVFATLMIVAPRRHETLVAVAVMSFAALMHKAFTGLAEISSGPPALYVTSFDIVVFLLWFAWFVRGPWEMWGELVAAFRRPIMYVPAVAGLSMVPGLLVANNVQLAGAEVVRMLAMYLVFIYFAVRIRTRTEVWVVLGALMTVLLVEVVVVAGQYVTRSSLGLSLFGTPSILHNRFDGIAVARPFGTMAHPVFMGAVVGPLALIAFSLAVNIRRPAARVGFAAIAAIGVSPIILASARSASLALVVAFVALVVAFLITGRLEARVAGWSLLAATTLCVIASPYLLDLWNKSFKTEHFSLEWESRAELNRVAIAMFEDRPFFGHGLNNFEQVMDHYDRFGLIFADNPVHNMYLLQLAETGIVGFLGVLVLIVAFARWSLRLARARDRLYSAVGFGVAGALLFWGVEEFLVFSLRQDHPRALLFMLLGLVVSTSRLAGVDRTVGRATLVVAPHMGGGGGAGDGRPPDDPTPPDPFDRNGQAAPTHDAHDRPLVSMSSLLVIATAALGTTFMVAPPGDEPSVPPALTAPPTSEALPTTTATTPTATTPTATAPTSTVATSTTTTMTTTTTSTTTTSTTTTSTTTTTTVPQRGDDDVVLLRADTVPRGATEHEADLAVVATAIDRATGRRRIYTSAPGSDELVPITPVDGRDYSWPEWANNGTKIVFTARSGPPGSNEPLYWMNPDGTDMELLLDLGVRLGQPKISLDGTTLIMTAVIPGTVVTRILSWDLASGELVNLSEAGGGQLDSDPRYSQDGATIVFIDSLDREGARAKPGDVAIMATDGTGRRFVSTNGLYDTDPDLDRRGNVVTARYIGEGNPLAPDADHPFQVQLTDFVLVSRDIDTGEELRLTNGERCVELPATIACSPIEGSSYLPRYTPDGERIGYVTLLNSSLTCICTIGRDRSDPRILIGSTGLALSWFDWIVPGVAPLTAVLSPTLPTFIPPFVFPPMVFPPVPPGPETDEDVLTSYTDGDGRKVRTVGFGDTTPTVIDIPVDLDPREASWNAHRDAIVFTGTIDASDFPERNGPPPPDGERRSVHFTLSELDLVEIPQDDRTDRADQQLFAVDIDGSNLRRLTDPWTEDWRDGHRDADPHGNSTPDLSPDGRYVVYTSESTQTAESFVMRYDLVTGDVLSLSNATSGAMPVHDRDPSWAHSSLAVAFVSDSRGSWDVWTIDADGENARPLTTSDAVERLPVWSPDDRHLAYLSSDEGGRTTVIVHDRFGSPAAVALGDDVLPVRVSWSPDGRSLGIVHVTPDEQLDLMVVPAFGGGDPVVEHTGGVNETWIDWG